MFNFPKLGPSTSFGVMNAVDLRFNRRLTLYVVGSALFCLLIVALRLGIGATSYETTDGLGRPMGFNDPLYWEHYLIILRNFRLADLFKPRCVYEWVLALAHIGGVVLLLLSLRISSRLVRWYFAVQALVFPIGIPAVAILPMAGVGSLFRPMDREGFIDIPFIIVFAHPVWVLTSLFIMFAMRGEPLGLRKVWRRLWQLVGSGARTAGNAIG